MLAIATSARPVGVGSALPRPWPFQPDMYDVSSFAGLSGKARNSPKLGTPPLISLRLPMTNSRSTANQASTGAEPAASRQRRSLVASGSAARAPRPRRKATSRALPRNCRPATSVSGTWRNGATWRRRANTPGSRTNMPPSAESAAPACRTRPITADTRTSAMVTSTSCGTTSGRRRPPVSDSTVRIRLRTAWVAWRTSGRRPPRSSRWRPRAAGTTTTRAPLRCARQQRSTSSPWYSMAGSNPPMARNRSARIIRQAAGTANTSRTASCCSWSTSPGSTSGSTSPNRSTARPTCWSTTGWSHSTSFGPTMPALER